MHRTACTELSGAHGTISLRFWRAIKALGGDTLVRTHLCGHARGDGDEHAERENDGEADGEVTGEAEGNVGGDVGGGNSWDKDCCWLPRRYGVASTRG